MQNPLSLVLDSLTEYKGCSRKLPLPIQPENLADLPSETSKEFPLESARLLPTLLSPKKGGETGSGGPDLLTGFVVMGSAANSELGLLFMRDAAVQRHARVPLQRAARHEHFQQNYGSTINLGLGRAGQDADKGHGRDLTHMTILCKSSKMARLGQMKKIM